MKHRATLNIVLTSCLVISKLLASIDEPASMEDISEIRHHNIKETKSNTLDPSSVNNYKSEPLKLSIVQNLNQNNNVKGVKMQHIEVYFKKKKKTEKKITTLITVSSRNWTARR